METIKQLWPRTLWTTYYDDAGQQWFCIWRHWLWRASDIQRFRVAS